MSAARSKLSSLSAGPASTAVRRQGARFQDRTVHRFLPGDVGKYLNSHGKFFTTRENRDFLVRHGLEPDNGKMTRFDIEPALCKVASQYVATLAFSPRHVINPFDLLYLNPKGHPLAAMVRAKYARKVRDESLWIMFTSYPNAAAVVRTLTQRRLATALYRALEARGYRLGPGRGPDKEIRGTFWVRLRDPVAAAAQPYQRFGEVIAEALDRRCSQAYGDVEDPPAPLFPRRWDQGVQYRQRHGV